MKLKKVQIFLVVYIAVLLVKFAVKSFDPNRYITLKPVFDGVVVGLTAVCILYFAWIFISAWLRNKREEAAGGNGVK
jgi:hypothetical protein